MHDDVVQIIPLTDLDRCCILGVDSFKGGQIGPALVDRHRLGYAKVGYRSFEMTPRRERVASGAKREINAVGVLVQDTIKRLALPLEFDTRVVSHKDFRNGEAPTFCAR